MDTRCTWVPSFVPLLFFFGTFFEGRALLLCIDVASPRRAARLDGHLRNERITYHTPSSFSLAARSPWLRILSVAETLKLVEMRAVVPQWLSLPVFDLVEAFDSSFLGCVYFHFLFIVIR